MTRLCVCIETSLCKFPALRSRSAQEQPPCHTSAFAFVSCLHVQELRSSFASPRWWWFLHGASGVGSPPPRLPHHAPGGWFKLALINIAVVCLLPVCSCWSRPKHGMHHRDPHAEPLDLHARHDGGQDRDEQGEPALRSA